MSRNQQMDKIRELENRKRILKEGFSLFAEKGIENVSMKQIAKAAAVSEPTLFNYYQNKLNLVVEVSAFAWGEVWKKAFSDRKDGLEGMNAYELTQFFLDSILLLYQRRPDILRFSNNYKSYLKSNCAGSRQIRAQEQALAPMENLFHRKYEQAGTDGSIRNDISEEELFCTVIHTMLSVAERYTLGVVWADNHSQDHLKELMNVRDMILVWIQNRS